MATASGSTEDVSQRFEIKSPAYAMYQALKDLCLNNAEYFQPDDSESGQRLHAGFLAVIDHVDTVAPLVDEVRRVAPSFDFDEKSPGNGYRSFVAVVDMCVVHGVKLSRQVVDNRDSFLFRKSFYMREVEACGHVMASLGTCMHHLHTLLTWSKPGELFPSESHSPEELLKQAESINMYCFYGRCLGFQFCESMQTVLKTISIAMASFSEIYYGHGGMLSRATNSVWTGGKYFMDPELRARRIVNISQHASVDFCKSFWLLAESELLSRLPGMICPAIAVNKVIMIPPEPIEVINPDGTKVQIPLPTSHIGIAPIQVRLLSAVRREGMKIGQAKERGSAQLLGPSDSLIIHIHGGGFVAQSSRSHESYLRDWACQLGVPILSIDYSLAPRAPFPRALEEVLYAYCWALNNAKILGSTASKVLLVGDSAGGNLNLGITMKCIELGIRLPSGLFLMYVPVLVSFVPSPSRLLCLMDPLLPFGFMIRCLKAYACPSQESSECSAGSSLKTSIVASSPSDTTLEVSDKKKDRTGSDTESFEEVSESDLMELAAHKSPMSELGSDTLTTVSLTSLQSKPEVDQALPAVSEKRGAEKAEGGDAGTSEKYVSEFLEKYVLDSETDSEGRKVPVLRTEVDIDEHVLFELPHDLGLSAKLGRAAGNIASGVSNTFYYMTGKKSPDSQKQSKSPASPKEDDVEVSTLDSLMQRSPSEEFRFTVPPDPYLSPYWASDEVLKQFPPVGILSVQLDPCLDDCVMFAKRLKRLGRKVTLDVLDGLPHGFLNFSLLSREAHNGSNLCVKRMLEMLASFDKPTPST
ncbi:hormone-sensitive lipase isoform X2 [Anabrus simplex]|uniref:hormone-sensitive lipase isoform X2 n=1 Tax=Anabrus simplex TaxID=316456 RepID=UPI0035A31201